MLTDHIPANVDVEHPTYGGRYSSDKSPTAESWSWYLNGDRGSDAPHFTTFYNDDGMGEVHLTEVVTSPTLGNEIGSQRIDLQQVKRWKGFHLSLNLSSRGSIYNGHIFFRLKANMDVEQSGMTPERNMPSEYRGEWRRLTTRSMIRSTWTPLARAFVVGAVKGFMDGASLEGRGLIRRTALAYGPQNPEIFDQDNGL